MMITQCKSAVARKKCCREKEEYKIYFWGGCWFVLLEEDKRLSAEHAKTSEGQFWKDEIKGCYSNMPVVKGLLV